LNDMPWAMTAHVLYAAIDGTRAGSVSPIVIEDAIRRDIGFAGFLVSDDICMKALAGPEAARAVTVLAAGCDAALHCSGRLADMRAVADAVGPLTRAAADRFARANATKRTPEPLDRRAAEARLATLLGAPQV
jgi:beta-N-acetylhexosaminidase